ncbi:MAG: hypothetical protein JNL80_18740 [Phycisphaerae bacterium]|jgi:hypothetical protein|nr:hypothetical protein [Phycisphaerae bacterium]
MARTYRRTPFIGPKWLLATSLATAIGLAPMSFAAPPVGGGDDTPTKPKVIIGAAKKLNVAAAPSKASVAKANTAAKTTKAKATTKKISASAKKATKTASTQTSTPAPTQSSGGTNSSGNANGQVAAQTAAATPAPAPLKVLVNLNAAQYFTPEMQAQGVEELLVLYPHNFDAASLQTAKVDGQKVVAAVKAARGENPSGWVMLDYEVPFDEVFWNGKTDPRYAGMVASMIEAIKYAKEQLPNCKFTYYGVPNVRYYVANKGWDTMPEWSRIQTKDECLSVYLSLVKEMDWMSPCLYDRFDPAMHEESERASLATREAAFRLNTVKICDALRDAAGVPNMPIIPSVSVVFSAHGKAEVWAPISHDEFRSDQLDPSLLAGADGFFLWSSLEYNAWVASLSWVPTPGEQPRADARAVLAKLLYGGSAPASWTSTDSKNETVRRVAEFVAKYAKWTREAEQAVPRPANTAVAAGPNG